MTLLARIPLWGYFVLLLAAYLTGHVLAFRPAAALGTTRRTLWRWVSALLLLLALLLVSGSRPALVLASLALALAGGVVSGRTAPPPSAPRTPPD